MNETKHRQLAAIQREFAAVAEARLAALVRAQIHILSGALTVTDISHALGVTRGTWYRWQREFELRELAVECVAEVHQTLSTVAAHGGDETDAELALGAIGVWGRR